MAKLEGTLAAALDDVSASVDLYGVYNVSVTGTYVGSVWLERSFDAGVTWATVHVIANTEVIRSYNGREVEAGVKYRFKYGAYTSGTPSYRISTGTNF